MGQVSHDTTMLQLPVKCSSRRSVPRGRFRLETERMHPSRAQLLTVLQAIRPSPAAKGAQAPAAIKDKDSLISTMASEQWCSIHLLPPQIALPKPVSRVLLSPLR